MITAREVSRKRQRNIARLTWTRLLARRKVQACVQQIVVRRTLDEASERANDQPDTRVRTRERRVVREDHAEVRVATQTEVIDEWSKVTHVVRYDDATFHCGCVEDYVVVLAFEVRSLFLYRYGVDALPELLCDREVVVLVEQ